LVEEAFHHEDPLVKQASVVEHKEALVKEASVAETAFGSVDAAAAVPV
jgi:hypothetical protein